jgi:type 2 lantibiotic biosynthesis protein LanM
LEFFRQYPVLARLLGTRARQWIDATAELRRRLRDDAAELQRIFGDGRTLGRVTDLRVSLSDRHRGGRSVAALTFEGGQRVVYKPKDLGTEEAYNHLVTWLNDMGAPLPFRVLRTLNRSTHGWVELVAQKPCQSPEEARRYFRRAGALTALLYSLEATDCHCENIIASGEYPMLIDMETLLQHRPVVEDQEGSLHAHALVEQRLMDSVLHTGLLPRWSISPDRRVMYDISGLAGVAEQELEFRARHWEGTNTDRMGLEYRPQRLIPGSNVAMLYREPLLLQDYEEDLIAGFEEMYRFLMSIRDDLLATDGPFHRLGRQRVRYVHRDTKMYHVIERSLLNPQRRRDGADRGIALEALTRSFLPFSAAARAEGRRSRFWPVLAAERDALEEGDIPFFTARPDSDSLVIQIPAPEGTQSHRIEHAFLEPSLNRSIHRIETMTEADMSWQAALMRAAIAMGRATGRANGEGSVESLASTDRPATELSTDTPTFLDDEALVTEALRLAEQVRDHTIHGPDGSVAWIIPQYFVEAERYQIMPSDYNLYDGAGGIAMFLAAVHKVTGDGAYRDLALGALRPLRRDLRYFGNQALQYDALGAATGLGSMVYTLVRSAQLLAEPDLLADAELVAALISRERIESSVRLDVLSGVGGAILGLLALHGSDRGGDALERAILCGHRLLAARITSNATPGTSPGGYPPAYRTWAALGGEQLTGFSHGAAGIAYAMLRLHAVTGEEAFREAAAEAIAYEDSTFELDRGLWPDLRPGAPAESVNGWCNGAPGIGLARLGGLSQLVTEKIQVDLRIALQATQQRGDRGRDNVCCGTMGRAEILLTAGRRLGDSRLEEQARLLASQVVARARQSGSFQLFAPMTQGFYHPGFFQGTSGVGYVLLHLAFPTELPCVLLWE